MAVKPVNEFEPGPIGRNGTIPSLTRMNHGLMDWRAGARPGEKLDVPPPGPAPARPLVAQNHTALMQLNDGIVPFHPLRCRYHGSAATFALLIRAALDTPVTQTASGFACGMDGANRNQVVNRCPDS